MAEIEKKPVKIVETILRDDGYFRRVSEGRIS